MESLQKYDEVQSAHDGVEHFSLLTAGQNLSSEQFTRREVSVAKPAHDIVTLTPLPTARTSCEDQDSVCVNSW